MKSFIEVQFPISKLSAECQKERKSGSGQTLTGLGKWWGRKPLILVRATILGLLMPCSDNLEKDMEIFLKILTMDDDGLWLRNKNKTKFTKEEFDLMSYSDRLRYCIRPEHVDNLPIDSWDIINGHLKTNASNLTELICELGERKFGHKPSVGDVFCGGGSIPFESARIGCDTFASDLNPVAAMLTWASLNVLSKNDSEIEKLKKFQDTVYSEVKKKIDELGVEKNEHGEVADYYLYCNEVKCLHCNKNVPLSPSWVISAKSKTIAKLMPNGENFIIEVLNNASDEEFKNAKKGTVVKGKFHCPNCNEIIPISTLRGDRKNKEGSHYGLRMWDNKDIVAKDTDVFKERLYCIRYVDTNGNKKYVTPTEKDLLREEKVLKYVQEHFCEWQDKGFIPSDKIIQGDKTSEVIRTRGWTYWHHLFNPRQLLIHGLFFKCINESFKCKDEMIVSLLSINRLANFNSKITMWDSGLEKVSQTFSNQALNTQYNYTVRCLSTIKPIFLLNLKNKEELLKYTVTLSDARVIEHLRDIWVTDPPYADAINYHELTDFFLAWDKKAIPKAFPEWYADSKRELAVKGADQSFVDSMVEVYSNLTNYMNDNGYQVIMFTHQDVKVWSDLVPIIVKSGLEVCQAWTISTETESGGLKKDSGFVQGTVLLILKKKSSEFELYEDQLYEEVEIAIENQMKEMMLTNFYNNFTDNDYILSSYATCLKVLTHCDLVDIDLDKELKCRQNNLSNKIDDILNHANNYALKLLIPNGIDKKLWNSMSVEERFYIKTLYSEMNGNTKMAPIMESAKVFGINNYKSYLQFSSSNNSRIKTASEFKSSLITNDKFGNSLLRHVLKAICESVENDNADIGRQWLSNNTDYAVNETTNKTILAYLRFISDINKNNIINHWDSDCRLASALYMLISNEKN